MTNTFLYTTIISEQSAGSVSSKQGKNISSQSSLTTDFGTVNETGSRPGDRPISGALKGQYADIVAKELSELGQAPNYGNIALFTDDNDPKNDGYVTIESFDVNPANPRQNIELWEFSGRISEDGTQRSHYRAIETQTTSVDNPFSGASDNAIAIPATATKVAWYDEKGQQYYGTTLNPTVLSGRFIDVERYDPDDTPFDNPTLIGKVPYADEGKCDARVWDDFDRSQLDANGINSWQKVFSTDHNFKGGARVENGLLRLELDEDEERINLEEWDDANSTYSTVQINQSDWVLQDYNFTRISPSRVEGQIRFRDTSGPAWHSLNFQVNRAIRRVLFTTPPNEGSIPSGLETALNPIASEWKQEHQANRKILSRREVNE